MDIVSKLSDDEIRDFLDQLPKDDKFTFFKEMTTAEFKLYYSLVVGRPNEKKSTT